MNKHDSMTPVRRGAIYCAPACGYGCTYEAYQQAVKDAKDLRIRLQRAFLHCAEPWTFRVWENMGWFYAAISPCRRIQIYPPSSHGGGYTAFLGAAARLSSRYSSDGRTSSSAVRNVIKAAAEDLATFGATLEWSQYYR